MISVECYFIFVFLLHPYLVVSFVCVQKAFPFQTLQRLYFLIYLGELVVIFWASFIEICVVYAHSPAFVVFSNHDWVGYLGGKDGLPENACSDDFVYLYVYYFVSVSSIASHFLFYYRAVRFDIHIVLYHFSAYPNLVCLFPCENVFVFSYQVE